MTKRQYIEWNLGLRLVLACFLVCAGQFAMAAFTTFGPLALPTLGSTLGLTAEQTAEQEALLVKVRAEARKELDLVVKAVNEDGEKKMNEIIEKRIAGFKDLPVDKLKKMVEDMEEINKTVADLKAKSAARKVVGKKEILLRKEIQKHWEPMQKAFSGGSNGYRFALEGKKTITSTDFGNRVIIGFREAGVDFEALPEVFILDLIQTMSGGVGSNPLSWIERNSFTQTGPPLIVANPTLVAEGATKPTMGFKWVERTMPAQTIAAIVPVTKQAVYNYAMLENEIRFELMRRIALVLQQQILKGTGTGGEMTGLFTYARAFNPGVLAGTVVQPNEFDVLAVAATQVLNANFAPTLALITHTSKASMSMAKSTEGVYVLPPFITAGGLEVYGMKVRSTNVLVDDEFLVMDPTKALFNWVEGITLEVGMINDDFEKNIWRIRAELQGMLRVKEHERDAFVKGDFSVAKGLLDAAA